MSQKFEEIERSDTVVSVPEHYCVVTSRSMFKIEEFAQQAKTLITSGNKSQGYSWIQGGAPCEILEPGKNWQKGRVRVKISLEFCPDETQVLPKELDNNSNKNLASQSPDSSLDDIRSIINEG